MSYPVVAKPEDLAPWLEAVPWGTCVTLADGTVIDKRPLPLPAPLPGPTPNDPLGPSFPGNQWGPHRHDRSYT